MRPGLRLVTRTPIGRPAKKTVHPLAPNKRADDSRKAVVRTRARGTLSERGCMDPWTMEPFDQTTGNGEDK